MWLMPFVHLAAFFKDYVLRLAFLDGWRGYVVCKSPRHMLSTSACAATR